MRLRGGRGEQVSGACGRSPYLLQHDGLLLLQQRLQLLRREDLLLEDLLHLLRRDHLRTHHGHRHWNLGHTGRGLKTAAAARRGRRKDK